MTLHLKAATVLLQQALGGHYLRDTTGLKARVARRATGIPIKLIPKQDRALIRAGNVKVIKLWLTLLNVYRVITFDAPAKLDTITAPFTGDRTHELYKFVLNSAPAFLKALESIGSRPNIREHGLISTDVIPRSGPGTGIGNISSDPLVMLMTASALHRKGMGDSIKYFFNQFPRGQVAAPGPYTAVKEMMPQYLPKLWSHVQSLPNLPMLPSQDIELGRLGFKAEAAGKVRVFAMVDTWTQWALSPVHRILFAMLVRVPTDGTFNQMRPIGQAKK